jgi:geranylgeranyl pyrophosphate synthase
MTNIDIFAELKRLKPMIDEISEKYFPRKFEESNLKYILGSARYAYDAESVTGAVSEPMWNFLGYGGKRWRPALFLFIAEALGADTEKIKDFMVIPELIHNGTIIIDDIEDGSETRRGNPCLHIKHGEDLAINVGNTMYYMPMALILRDKANISSEHLIKLYEAYIQEMINIHVGQAMDIYWHKGLGKADRITEKEYLQMCAYKTGTLARVAARFAAILSGATDEQIESFARFAETVGTAFQIQDDILNLAGDPEKFVGKDIWEDITEGKRSLMVVHTFEKASEGDKKRLIEILGMHTKDKELMKEAIDIMKRYDAIDYSKQKAKELMEQSWQEIDNILEPSPAKNKLHAFAKFLIEREV